MKLRKGVKKVITLILVYVIAGIGIYVMSERVERLNEQERLEEKCNVAIKISELSS